MAQDKRPIEYKLRIVGTGRCGTTFMARKCVREGLMIGHDKLGRDGVSGLAWCDPEPPRAKDALPMGSFIETWHLVRHPLPCIASLAYSRRFGIAWPWIESKIDMPSDPLLRAMTYWLKWNERCEIIADKQIRIEDQAGDPVNCSEHRSVEWGDLQHEDEVLANEIALKAAVYGYKESSHG